MDGVLVDSQIWWHEVRVEFAQAHGRVWTTELEVATMGANSREWALMMRDWLDLTISAEAIERAIVDGVVERFRLEGAPQIDGAVDAVRRIASGRTVAVASSAHHDVIDAALAAIDLSVLFAAIVSSDDVARGKPAPDVYLEAARRLGADPSRCLVVEDSINGVRAGIAAGMTVVLIPNEAVPPAPGAHDLADVVLERLADLDPAVIAPGRAASHPG